MQPTSISAQDRLREAGIRVTLQRVIILEYLMDNISHPTCDQIYSDIKDNQKSMSFASVYNVTDKLAQAGLIRRIVSPAGEYHYDGIIIPHGHFFCEKCSSIMDIPLEKNYRFEELPGTIIHSYNFTATGICSNCNKN